MEWPLTPAEPVERMGGGTGRTKKGALAGAGAAGAPKAKVGSPGVLEADCAALSLGLLTGC